MAKVVALIDRDEREGTVRRSACALLTLARRLGEPVAVCAAKPDEAAIRALGRFGATEIWWPDGSGASASAGEVASASGLASVASAALASALAVASGVEPADGVGFAGSGSAARSVSETDLLAAVAKSLDLEAILIASTVRGQETAARLAIRLDSGIITDAIDVRPGPIAVQRCLADSHLVESTVIRGVPIITVRPEAAVPEPSDPIPGAAPTLHTIPVEPSKSRTPRITTAPKPPFTPDLADIRHADVIVAGGRGVGSAAAFAVLADVAEALGAALAGSHTAADLGWIPPEACVDLTGKTVSPLLYLACGVSGSVRHRAGMQGAKTVVAIGDDPAAPIFKLAELGVVGDARAILPALLAEIQKRTQPS